MDPAKRAEAIDELRETQEDRKAFAKALDAVSARLRDLEDNPARYEMLRQWPATQVVLNGLVLCVTKCEGIIEEYRELLDQDTPDNVVSMEGRNGS